MFVSTGSQSSRELLAYGVYYTMNNNAGICGIDIGGGIGWSAWNVATIGYL